MNSMALDELIEIADGRVRIARTRWYTFGIPLSHRATLDEQFEAIQQIATTNELGALEYLERLSQRESKSEGWNRGTESVDISTTWHPYAKGELFRVLKCRTGSAFDQAAGEGFVEGQYEHPSCEEAESIIRNAVSRRRVLASEPRLSSRAD
jgi:hypothetical protein